jgi:hypothetical protein
MFMKIKEGKKKVSGIKCPVWRAVLGTWGWGLGSEAEKRQAGTPGIHNSRFGTGEQAKMKG